MAKQSKTNLLKYEIAQFMKSSVLVSGSNTYISIGRPLYWGTDSVETSDEVGDVVLSTNYLNEARRNMIAMKKVEPSDIGLVVPRSDWVSGVVYEHYNDHIEMYNHEKKTFVGKVFANANLTMNGTVNVTTSTTVVGSNTLFTTLIVGDQITVNNQTRFVASITDNNNLVVTAPFTSAGNGNTMIVLANNRLVRNTAGVFSGNLDFGIQISINDEKKEIVELKNNYVALTNGVIKLSYSNQDLFTVQNKYPLYANTFYARNSRDQVFKCLYTPFDQNGNHIPSTVEPTIDIDGQLPEDPYIETGDLYKWKYLYTIPYGLKQKFFTKNWMPVVSETSVVNSSQGGRIDIIEILSGGTGYYLNGQSGNNASYPVVTISGDGVDATATAQVESGVITELNILNGGSGYTTANVSITDPFQLATGTPAQFDVIIGPPDGHGSNPAKELGCYTVMISLELNNTENGKIPISGFTYGGDFDFRQIMMIRDPKYANGVFATDSVYRTAITFNVSDVGSEYVNDESVSITGEFSGVVSSFDYSLNSLYVINSSGTYTNATGKEIRGAASGAAAAVLSVVDPDINILSGDILYIENRLPIIRNANQTEQVRLVFSF